MCELASVPVSAAEVTGALFTVTPVCISEEAGLSGEGLVLAKLLAALLLPVTVTPVGTVRRWVTGPCLASVVSPGEVPLGGLLFRVGSPGTSTAGEGLTAVSVTFDATPRFVSVCRVCWASPVNRTEPAWVCAVAVGVPGRGALGCSEAPRAAVLVLCPGWGKDTSTPAVTLLSGLEAEVTVRLFSPPGAEVLVVVSAGEVKDRALSFAEGTPSGTSHHKRAPVCVRVHSVSQAPVGIG